MWVRKAAVVSWNHLKSIKPFKVSKIITSCKVRTKRTMGTIIPSIPSQKVTRRRERPSNSNKMIIRIKNKRRKMVKKSVKRRKCRSTIQTPIRYHLIRMAYLDKSAKKLPATKTLAQCPLQQFNNLATWEWGMTFQDLVMPKTNTTWKGQEIIWWCRIRIRVRVRAKFSRISSKDCTHSRCSQALRELTRQSIRRTTFCTNNSSSSKTQQLRISPWLTSLSRALFWTIETISRPPCLCQWCKLATLQILFWTNPLDSIQASPFQIGSSNAWKDSKDIISLNQQPQHPLHSNQQIRIKWDRSKFSSLEELELELEMEMVAV